MYRKSTFSFRWRSALFVVTAYLATLPAFAQLPSDRQQKMRMNVQNDKNVAAFVFNDQLRTPSFITFNNGANYLREKAPELIRQYFLLTGSDELKLQTSTAIPGGMIVERYKQYRNGVKVEHSAYIVTIKGDSKIFSINAESFDLPASFSVKPKLQEQLAQTKVLSFTNARKYAWQDLEKRLSQAKAAALETSGIEALINEYSPKGELVIAKALYQGGGARLAYKYDIYATEPVSRNLIYVDANTGEILLVDPIIKHAEKHETKIKPLVSRPYRFGDLSKFSGIKKAMGPLTPLRTAASVLGTGTTRYAGVRNIYTTKLTVPLTGTMDPNNTLVPLTFSGIDPRIPVLNQDVYILKDDTRGGGVETFDMNAVGGLPISVPGIHATSLAFVDKDNIWKDEANSVGMEDLMRGTVQPPTGGGADEAFNDDMAIDAHWGAEMVYDYWKARHGRFSYDNKNTSIKSYVHYGPAYDNAFWNGSVMTYGDGSGGTAGGFKPLVSLDVCAHEIGHGVCSFTADLVYQSESGAMNEALSDIWASALENYVKLNVDASLPYQPFQIGEQIDPGNVGLRRMDNPKAFGNPDTYNGTNWVNPNCTPTLVNDQCGVHNNSGVLNKWFYLLVKGPLASSGLPLYADDGVNDAGGNYGALPGFVGLGFEKSEKITYLMELMLTPNATYADARVASINAAKMLYGDCSQEEITVTDAWFGVNVGAAFTSCTSPLLSVKTTVTQVSEFAAGGCDRYTDYTVNTVLTAAQGSAVTVNFTGSGTLGADEYQIIPSSVTYNAGEFGLKPVVVRIFDDAMVEGDESLTITANSAVPSLNTVINIAVTDDDVAPVIGGTVTLLNETFEGTAANAIPAGWNKIDKLTPSPVTWKVLTHPLPTIGLPLSGVLYWPGKRAVIEAPLTPGLATYNTLSAAQTILSTPKINALGLSTVKVSFVYSAGGEPACDPACDYGQLVYSLDGSNFTPFTAESIPLYAQLTDATVNVTLPAAFNNKQFYLGFLWNNDPNAGLVASISIDNVLVTATGRSIEGDLSATISEKVSNEAGKSSYFYSSNDHQLIASIKNASTNLGCVTATVTEAGDGAVTFVTTGKRSKKVFTVTPTQGAGATYTISLYYKTSELATGTGFTVAPSALKMVKSNAATIEGSNTSNSELVVPIFENHSADGYYSYTFTFMGFSKFFLAELTTLPSALPVTLVNFKAQKSEDAAKLSWITTSEDNSSHFEVEHSLDATNFSVLGSVKAAGTTASQKSYEFTDQSPVVGTNYYRLKMVDIDGTHAYSKMLPLEFDSQQGITVYPNPASEKLTVKFDTRVKAATRLINTTGQIVRKKNASGISAEFDVSDLPAGIYLLEVTRENGVKEVQKLMIRR